MSLDVPGWIYTMREAGRRAAHGANQRAKAVVLGVEFESARMREITDAMDKLREDEMPARATCHVCGVTYPTGPSHFGGPVIWQDAASKLWVCDFGDCRAKHGEILAAAWRASAALSNDDDGPVW